MKQKTKIDAHFLNEALEEHEKLVKSGELLTRTSLSVLPTPEKSQEKQQKS